MSFLTLNKVNISVLILICFLVLIVPDLLSAQTPADAEKVDSSFIERILWSIVNGFFGVLVWLSGMLLNTAVTDYVVGFGNKFIDTGLGFAVNNLWTTVRDIFNLTFIFGLVYIGFKMILDSSDSNARKMLVHIILAALLVNFSLFFTKFIVDFSNIAATQIASSFNTGGTGNYLVSDKFMNELGLSKIWGDNINLNNLSSGNGNGLTYIFMTMIVFIVTAFVFFAGALLLMIRFVVLNLYMILSPVMFLGWVFPGMASYSQMWWSGFLGRAFFAPAYLLMLYFAATILTEFAALGNSSGLGAIFLDGNVAKDEFVNSVPYFVMMCVFLIASIVVGQKMGADGANMAISFGKNMAGRARQSVQRGAGSVTFGAAGWVGQKTAGLAGHSLSNNKKLNEYAGKGGWRGKVGEYGIKASRKVGDASYDVRQVAGLGKTLGIGEGTKGGYSSRIKEQEKEDLAFQKSLKQNVTRDENGDLTEEADKAIKESVSTNPKIKALDADIKTVSQTFESLESELTASKADLEKARKDTSRTNEILGIEAKIKEQEKSLASNKAKGEAKEKELEALQKKVSDAAEADYKYANQIGFRNRREEEGKAWQSSSYLKGAGVVGGVVGGVAALGVGAAAFPVVVTAGLAAAISSAVAGAYGVQNLQVANTLARTYGKNGSAMTTNDKAAKEIKLLKDKLDEAGKSDTSKPSVVEAQEPAESSNPKT